MILHIVIDHRFINCAYRVFEEVSPGNNIFLIVGETGKVRYTENIPIQIISDKMFLSKSFSQSLVKFDMVIFHWMHDLNLRLITKIPEKVKLVWIAWGGDYYDLITEGDESKLFQPITKSLFERNTKKNSDSTTGKIKKIATRLISKKIKKSEIINRIDYFSPVLYEDYELIKKVLPDFKPKYIPWNYGTLEDDLIRGFENFTITGNNILIGNSATYENNHLDTFKILSTIKTGNRMILSPISYGDPVYSDNIIHYGKGYWGNRFVPVIEFMSIDKYIDLISSCSVIIMNHLRQQAMGNIITMMYLGAKVFLNKENTVYQFFKKEGAYIFDIDELELEINTRLTDRQIEHNRNILRMHWGREIILAKTRKLIASVSVD